MAHSTSPTIHVPQPRRPGTFSLTPIATEASSTSEPSPLDDPASPSAPDDRDQTSDAAAGSSDQTSESSAPPPKSRSILNLTSSTLFGIYNPAGYDSNRDEPPTPFGTGTLTPAWGNGAQTPVRSSSIDVRSFFPRTGPTFSEELIKERAAINKERKHDRRKSELQNHNLQLRRHSPTSRYLFVLLRTAFLFSIGIGYGALIAQLHDAEPLSPVKVEKLHGRSWLYILFWGSMGAALGSLMPLFDVWWPESSEAVEDADEAEEPVKNDGRENSEDGEKTLYTLGAEWHPLVRSIGAFVGIAFAIRKLAWQSTLQVSMTLALVNPFLWYTIDRTRVGFLVALVTGIAGAALLLAFNPDWVPSPASPPLVQVPEKASVWRVLKSATQSQAAQPVPLPSAMTDDSLLHSLSYESVGVATWIASVLFCSSIFFGSIGRRLSLDRLL